MLYLDMGRQTVIPWSEIRAAHACGLTLKACAEKFNIKEGTIFSRASREGWSRTMALAHAAARENAAKTISTEVVSKEAHVVLAEDLAERGEKHRVTMAKMVEDAMDKASFNMPPVEKMQDLKILDDIARRNYGLDSEHTTFKGILNLNILVQD